MKIDRIGNITPNSNGSFFIDGWFFAGPAIVDAENNTITDKWILMSIKVGRLLRKIFGYKILSFFGAYKNRTTTIAGWTLEELVRLSSNTKTIKKEIQECI